MSALSLSTCGREINHLPECEGSLVQRDGSLFDGSTAKRQSYIVLHRQCVLATPQQASQLMEATTVTVLHRGRAKKKQKTATVSARARISTAASHPLLHLSAAVRSAAGVISRCVPCCIVPVFRWQVISKKPHHHRHCTKGQKHRPIDPNKQDGKSESPHTVTKRRTT